MMRSSQGKQEVVGWFGRISMATCWTMRPSRSPLPVRRWTSCKLDPSCLVFERDACKDGTNPSRPSALPSGWQRQRRCAVYRRGDGLIGPCAPCRMHGEALHGLAGELGSEPLDAERCELSARLAPNWRRVVAAFSDMLGPQRGGHRDR